MLTSEEHHACGQLAAGVSERYASQLISATTVLKVHSPFYNYYSRFFLPWEHYIPVKYDMSDLLEKVSPSASW